MMSAVEYQYSTDGLDAGYSITLSNGVAFAWSLTRDAYRRSLVTGIDNSANNVVVESFAYAFDALNRPVSRNADTFGYNDRSEVTNAIVSGQTEFHAYDEIGNSLWGGTASNSYSYVSNSRNQYAEVWYAGDWGCPSDPVASAYDADANMTQFGEWTYTYDAANRLKTVATNGVPLLTNFYDAKSRRVKKVTPEATTTFFYDDWNLIEERVAYTNGTYSAIRYFWGKDLSGTLQGAGGVGGLLYLTVDGAVYIPFYDNIGNVTRYLDENGETVAQYTYGAFGKLIAKSGPLADFFRHRFSTKYFDPESGLYYYGYRFYHPSLMRWLTRDPIEEEGGSNLYVFCRNNALSGADELGAFTIKYVTSKETSFFEYVKTSKKFKDIEPKNENDLYVRYKPMNVNGAFHNLPSFDNDCQLEVRLEIWLDTRLREEANASDEFIVSPHKYSLYDGYSHKKGGGRPMEGAVLAHELGHAKAFFMHQKSVFESKIATLRSKPRLTESEKNTVKDAYKAAETEITSQSILYSKENEHNWYINHGFECHEKGGLYVYKLKK